jgi:hypothetical protein
MVERLAMHVEEGGGLLAMRRSQEEHEVYKLLKRHIVFHRKRIKYFKCLNFT